MPASSADATVGGHQKREDEIAVLARFVRRVPIVYSRLSVADSSQLHSATALQRCGKTMRRGCLSTFTPNLQSVTD